MPAIIHTDHQPSHLRFFIDGLKNMSPSDRQKAKVLVLAVMMRYYAKMAYIANAKV